VSMTPVAWISQASTATALIALSIFGAAAASAGGASIATGALRVTFWGALAMALSAAVGSLFGAMV
jgi:VIT1/CCC1 family predicted Fe2+/Mn2+ transporter